MIGIVADKETMQPIPYANVVILDSEGNLTKKGVVTNGNGEFSIDADNVQISFLGYKDLKTTQTATNIYYLESDIKLLDEVVIYGKKAMKNKWLWISIGIASTIGIGYYIYNNKK